MIIIYCEHCGRRIADAEVSAGKAVQTGENEWLCGNCVPAGAKPAPAAQPVDSAPTATAEQPVRKNPTTVIRRGSESHATRKNNAVTLYAGVAGGVLALVVIVVLMRSGGGAGTAKPGATASASQAGGAAEPVASSPNETKSSPVGKPAPAGPVGPVGTVAPGDAAGSAQVKREPSGTPVQPATPLSAAQPVELPDAKQSGAPAQASAAPLSLADRARQAEQEMENFRNGRAQRLLDDARQMFQQNPADVRGYKRKLNEIVSSYGSAPAAAEARTLIGELKTQPAQPDELSKNVSESAEYKLVYDMDLARAEAEIVYDEDLSSQIEGPFDRIAYVLEVQTQSGEAKWVYISMDAFTTDLRKIGVPQFSSGASFQQRVTNMNVFTNVEGVVAGTGLPGGYLEFWPTNYGSKNASNISGASDKAYDFGDEPVKSGNYGSMQIHNIDAKQTVLAFNHWVAASNADIGIGNQPAGNPDWTFSGSSKLYSSKRLRVLVRPRK